MGNLATEGPVVHEQDLEVLGVVDDEFLQAVREEELGGVVRTVTDFGHLLVASESSPHAVVDT